MPRKRASATLLDSFNDGARRIGHALPRLVSTPGGRRSHQHPRPRRQKGFSTAELQVHLFRLEGRLNNRLLEAFAPLVESGDLRIRHSALARLLALASAAIDIAISPQPKLGLVDLTAFIEITQASFERYWIPDVFSQQGKALITALSESKAEAWNLVNQAFEPARVARLSEFLRQWLEANAEVRKADLMRFSQFSDSLQRERSGRAEAEGIAGVIQDIQQAMSAADAARLMAERALYYSERLPFLLRLQARAGALELFQEGYVSVASLENKAREVLAITKRRGLQISAIASVGYVAAKLVSAFLKKRLV